MVPSRLARLPATCPGNTEERRGTYTIKVITCSSDLQDAILGDESLGEDFENHVNMDTKAKSAPMTATCNQTSAFMMLSRHNSLTNKTAVDRGRDAGARLEATYALGLPVLIPRTKWIGDDFNGAMLIATCITKFVP